MNIKELNHDKTCYHVQVVVPNENLQQEINAKLSEVAKTAKMDGFRAGKVPAHLLKKKYLPSVRMEVVEQKVNEIIQKLIEEKNLNVAFDPEIEDVTNEDDKDFQFTLKFELMPEVKLPEFEKITIEKLILNVDSKEVDEYIDRMVDQMKFYDQQKEQAAEGDQVTIDAVGYVDAEAFEGGKLNDHKLVLGSKTFIPGFEDQLIGSKKGDEVEVKVDFPTEYHVEDLAGKPAVFKVIVKDVHGSSKIEINDEFAIKLQCKDLADLKTKIQETIQESYQEPIHTLMKMELFDKLEKLVDFDAPVKLLNQEVKVLNAQKEQLEQDEEIAKMSEDEKQEYFKKIAKRRVCVGLILAEYMKNHKLNIDEEDVKKAIIHQARQYPGQEYQVIEFYQKNPQAFNSLKGPLLENKAVEDIFQNRVKLSEKNVSKIELEELLQKSPN